jgi:hypothetical protein
LDCDGDVDFDDIDAFVLGLLNPVAYEDRFGVPATFKGDIDGDGGLDFDDIDEFVALLRGAPTAGRSVSVPEPATAWLAAFGLVGVIAFVVRRSKSLSPP